MRKEDAVMHLKKQQMAGKFIKKTQNHRIESYNY